VVNLNPTTRGGRHVHVRMIEGLYWVRGERRRDGDWATDSTLYEVKMDGSTRFVEIHRRRGIRGSP
jgi:hypothetical protein